MNTKLGYDFELDDGSSIEEYWDRVEKHNNRYNSLDEFKLGILKKQCAVPGICLVVDRPTFQDELKTLINRYSMEGRSDTPDFILAEYIKQCLDTFDMCVRKRENWYGKHRIK